MGSPSVTCPPTQVNAPRITPARQAVTRLTHLRGMEGWVDLGGWVCTETVYLSAERQSSIQAVNDRDQRVTTVPCTQPPTSHLLQSRFKWKNGLKLFLHFSYFRHASYATMLYEPETIVKHFLNTSRLFTAAGSTSNHIQVGGTHRRQRIWVVGYVTAWGLYARPRPLDCPNRSPVQLLPSVLSAVLL